MACNMIRKQHGKNIIVRITMSGTINCISILVDGIFPTVLIPRSLAIFPENCSINKLVLRASAHLGPSVPKLWTYVDSTMSFPLSCFPSLPARRRTTSWLCILSSRFGANQAAITERPPQAMLTRYTTVNALE